MRTCSAALLAGLALALATTRAADEDKGAALAAQKKAADAAWEAIEAGPLAVLETKHLLIYAPKSMEKRLKYVGATLEAFHDRAAGALSFDFKEGDAYPGKITVYLLPERDLLAVFARRVEKRRPTGDEVGSFSASNARLHAVAAVMPGKGPSVESLAGQQVAGLLLMRKAGRGTPVADWLVTGFGRATAYRVQPREAFVLAERKQARVLSARRKASEVWAGSFEAEEADAMNGSVADFLAYGPGAARFLKLVNGFKLEEGMKTRTTAQAMEAAGIKAANVDRLWKKWALNPR